MKNHLKASTLLKLAAAAAVLSFTSNASAQIWSEDFDADSLGALGGLDACSAPATSSSGATVRSFAENGLGCSANDILASVVADPTGASGNSLQIATPAARTGCTDNFWGLALDLPGIDECGGVAGGFDATGFLTLDIDVLVPATTSAANEAVPDAAEDPNAGIGALGIKFEDEPGRGAGNNWAKPRIFLNNVVTHASGNNYDPGQSDSAFTSLSIPLQDLDDTTWSWDAVVAGSCCGTPDIDETQLRSLVFVESDNGAVQSDYEVDFTIDNIAITAAVSSVQDWTVYE